VNKETEEYYNDFFELFRAPGWTRLIEEFQQNADLTNSVENVKDSNDLYFKKGQLTVLALILNLETYINRGYENASTEDV
jgi:hypothetical protein